MLSEDMGVRSTNGSRVSAARPCDVYRDVSMQHGMRTARELPMRTPMPAPMEPPMLKLKKAGRKAGRKAASKAAPALRVPLGLRVTPEIKKRLDDAARDNGRSQSQEGRTYRRSWLDLPHTFHGAQHSSGSCVQQAIEATFYDRNTPRLRTVGPNITIGRYGALNRRSLSPDPRGCSRGKCRVACSRARVRRSVERPKAGDVRFQRWAVWRAAPPKPLRLRQFQPQPASCLDMPACFGVPPKL